MDGGNAPGQVLCRRLALAWDSQGEVEGARGLWTGSQAQSSTQQKHVKSQKLL